jgi:hypothetical protein
VLGVMLSVHLKEMHSKNSVELHRKHYRIQSTILRAQSLLARINACQLVSKFETQVSFRSAHLSRKL